MRKKEKKGFTSGARIRRGETSTHTIEKNNQRKYLLWERGGFIVKRN